MKCGLPGRFDGVVALGARGGLDGPGGAGLLLADELAHGRSDRVAGLAVVGEAEGRARVAGRAVPDPDPADDRLADALRSVGLVGRERDSIEEAAAELVALGGCRAERCP